MTCQQRFLFMSGLALLFGNSALTVRATAQERPLKNSFELGGGAAVPAADLRPYMSSSFLLRLGYGYRLHRNLQADFGLEGVFGAAGVKRVERSAVGDIKIDDSEVLVPFGARAILPLAHDRFELHAGGGGMYLHYAEEASVPEGVTVICYYGSCTVDVDCPACRSRSGWGYYGRAGAAISLDRRHRCWLGLDTRLIRGTTSGQALGSVPEFRTKDQWVNTTIALIFRW